MISFLVWQDYLYVFEMACYDIGCVTIDNLSHWWESL